MEYATWIKEQRVPKDTDVLKYWQGKRADYPIMSQMTRDYLAIPATSAASKRVFSNGGDILTKKRNRLASDTLRYLLCLRSWGAYSEPTEQDIDIV